MPGLIAFAALISGPHLLSAAFQPMLLSAGKFSLEAGSNMIQVAAACLDRSLEIPEAGHAFDQFSDGVTVTRTLGESRQSVSLQEAIRRGWVQQPQGQDSINNVGFAVSEKETKLGATFEIEVSDKKPQFVASGASQVNDVKKLFSAGGNVIANADSIVANFLEGQLPLWKELLGDDFPVLLEADPDQFKSLLRQRLLWAVRGTSHVSADEGARLLSQQFGEELGIPLKENPSDLADRLEVYRGATLSDHDYDLLNTVSGKSVSRSVGFYRRYVKIEKDDEKYRISYQGTVRSYDTLAEACALFRREVPPPLTVIFDADEIPPLTKEEAATLLQQGFHYVTDKDFFLQHGPIRRPQRVIVIASDDSDPAVQANINKTIFGGQSVGDLSSISNDLKSKLGSDVKFVTTKQDLLNEVSMANGAGDVPIVIGHNEHGRFILGDGSDIEIASVSPTAVPFSCSLFDVASDELPLLTTMDFDVKNLLKAVGDTLSKKGGSTILDSPNTQTDFISSLVAAYDERQKRQGIAATSLGIIGLGSVACGVIMVSHGGSSQ